MQEAGEKRQKKTHDFTSDEEARLYLDSILPRATPTLPKVVWIKILSENPHLSVQDIQRMCRVNRQFREVCDSGIIWDRIFERQFGLDTLRKARAETYGGDNPLLRLLTWRIYTQPPHIADGAFVHWTLKYGGEVSLKYLSDDPYDEGLMYTLAAAYGEPSAKERAFFELIVPAMALKYGIAPLDLKKGDYEDEIIFENTNNALPFGEEMQRSIIYHALQRGYRPVGPHDYFVGDEEPSSSSSSSFFFCLSCDAPATDLCSGCEIATYCGTKCQAADWDAHRLYCGARARTPIRSKKGRRKFAKVMREFKAGKLRSGRGGAIVKSRKQALAIAFAEARK